LDEQRKFQSSSISIEFMGTIDMPFENGGQTYPFVTLKQTLVPTSSVLLNHDYYTFPFTFGTVKMPYESYEGKLVEVRYYLRVVAGKSRFVTDLIKEQTIWVADKRTVNPLVQVKPAMLEVGLEEYLQIKIEFDNTEYIQCV